MTETDKPSESQPEPSPAGAAGPQAAPMPPAEPCPPCPPCPAPEISEGLHTRFARLFFGVITLLVLYFSYLIIKPYLLDIFMALVLFFTSKPLFLAPRIAFRSACAPALPFTRTAAAPGKS